MRLGIFGGTFDPVHFGHLVLAEQCREQCRLDEVWFLPCSVPPHKQKWPISDARHRADMLKFAVAGHEDFRVNEMELQREGTTYTVDTLTQITREQPDAELHFLIGSDSLYEFASWREPERITELATIVAGNRGIQSLPHEEELPSLLGDAIAGCVRLVRFPGNEISASDLRHRVRAGKSIRYMTPRPVEVYIQQQKMYGSE